MFLRYGSHRVVPMVYCRVCAVINIFGKKMYDSAMVVGLTQFVFVLF
jgi:hypothetical protein